MSRYLLWFVMALLPPSLLAQSQAVLGSVEGSVVDVTGGAVAGVRVTAIHQDSGARRTAETDEAGRFRFTALPIGSYTLRFEKEDFGPVSVVPFLLSVGQTVVEHIEMQPARRVERVEVREQAGAVDTTSAAPSVPLGYERVEEAPAPGRNYLNFALVAPGVTSSTSSSAQLAGPTLGSALADSGFIFGGLRARNNSITIDGVDNRDETTGGTRVSVGLEMVQEFRVSGVSMPAQYGGAAGGTVNVVTRSGTNIWHGDGTFFFQNEIFNARRPDIESASRPIFRRYQPGTSINGPIRKDRTFVAAAVETEWESDAEWSDVPQDALDAINRALAAPAFAGVGVHSALRGIFDSNMRATDASIKLTHQAGIHSLSSRYAFSRGRVLDGVQDVANFSDRSARGSSLTQDHSFMIGWTAVPGEHFASDLRFQIARRAADLAPNASGAMLEIPGVVTLGEDYRLNGSRAEDHFEVIEDVSAVRGRHQLSMGADLHRTHLNARLANRFGGIYIFPTLADFVASQPDVFLQAFGDPGTKMTTSPLGLWFNDRWQPLGGLTLNAGLRYDRQWMPDGIPASSWNFGPRLGLAWRPKEASPFVIRAGFGLFYDRYPLAFLNDAVQKDDREGFEQYLAGAAAVEAFDLSHGGPFATPIPGVSPSLYRPDSDFPATYSRKVGVGFEYGLNKDTTLTVQYNNVRGFHLPRLRNIRGGLPPLYQLEQTARSAHQGGSVYVNRRMSHELSFLVDYDFGETWDDASDFDEQPLNPFNLKQDWARSRQDQAHRIAASALFELPAEEWRGAPDWLRAALERITVAPVLIAGSGRPINALDSTDTFRTGAYPISARPVGLPRNPFFSPRTFSLDLRLAKRFPIKHDRAWLNAGVEAFNLTNHSNFVRVSPYNAARGTRLGSYGNVVEALNARQIEFLFTVEY